MSFCGRPRDSHFCEGYSCSYCPRCIARSEKAILPPSNDALKILRETDLCNNEKRHRPRLCRCGFSTGNPERWASHQEKIHGKA